MKKEIVEIPVLFNRQSAWTGDVAGDQGNGMVFVSGMLPLELRLGFVEGARVEHVAASMGCSVTVVD